MSSVRIINRTNIFIALILCIAVFYIYSGTTGYDFINFDDPVYVTDNPAVKGGITYEGIAWAFGIHSDICMYWQPVAWLSHMLDCELFGTDPGLHHLSSLSLHILNVLLLYLLLLKSTGSVFRSAFAAALFAVHPVNADPVIWIAERKTLLSGFFWLTGFTAYYHYCKRPGIIRYLIVLFLFTLGLLSKPVMATFPCALLLYDIWPLKRLSFNNRAILKKRITEKLPFFFIFGLWSVTTLLSATLLANKTSAETIPFLLRISNALVVYPKYVFKFFCPLNLAIHYTYPSSVPLLYTVLALVFLISVSAIFIALFKKRPALLIGWFWFLGVLIPSSGLIHGTLWPEMADRWAYLPYIGLALTISWMLPDFAKLKQQLKPLMIICLIIPLIFFAVLAKRQAGYWKNSITVFRHALEVVGYDPLFHRNISAELVKKGKTAEALNHQMIILKHSPENIAANLNTGLIYARLNRPEKATEYLLKTIRLAPENENAYGALAEVYADSGNYEKAVEIYKKGIQNCSRISSQIFYNISVVLHRLERDEEAETYLIKLLTRKKNHTSGIMLYADILLKRRNYEKAWQFYSTAAKYAPDSPEAFNGIGISLAGMKQYDKAIESFNKALSLDPSFKKAGLNLRNTIIEKQAGEKSEKRTENRR